MYRSLFDKLPSCSSGSPFFVVPDPPVKEYIDGNGGYKYEFLKEISEKINSVKDILGLNALNYDTTRKDLRKTLKLAKQGQFLFTLYLTLSMGSFLITICKSNHKEPHSIPLILSIDERSETTLAQPEEAISEEAISASFIELSNPPEGNHTPLFDNNDNAEMGGKTLLSKEAWSAPGLGLGPGPTQSVGLN